MENLTETMKFIHPGERYFTRYNKRTGQWVFNINMDFERKTILVTCGHLTNPPQSMKYISVVYCNTVSILLTVYDRNNLDDRLFDISNAYINYDVDKRVYLISVK